MKTRSLKILYTILLESLKAGDKPSYFNSGICGEIEDLLDDGLMTIQEREKLNDNIKFHKPSNHKRFRRFTKIADYKPDGWWWERMRLDPKMRELRIEYIEAVLKYIQR